MKQIEHVGTQELKGGINRYRIMIEISSMLLLLFVAWYYQLISGWLLGIGFVGLPCGYFYRSSPDLLDRGDGHTSTRSRVTYSEIVEVFIVKSPSSQGNKEFANDVLKTGK